jgi:AcrR family transcriptional regulator
MDQVDEACRPQRADALRNRRRILEAAEEIFAKEGISVPVDIVAERAGVGVGTLYRHFPTKEALFEAIVLTKLDELVEATTVAEGDDPGGTFFDFLMRVADEASLKHDLFDALAAAGIDVKSRCGHSVHELEMGIDGLRQRAVDAGAVRADVTTAEIMGLVISACRAMERPGLDKESSRQMVGIICDGLRARP